MHFSSLAEIDRSIIVSLVRRNETKVKAQTILLRSVGRIRKAPPKSQSVCLSLQTKDLKPLFCSFSRRKSCWVSGNGFFEKSVGGVSFLYDYLSKELQSRHRIRIRTPHKSLSYKFSLVSPIYLMNVGENFPFFPLVGRLS